MTTLVLEVDNEQKKMLKSMLKYLKVKFHEVSNDTDFWDSLSEKDKNLIEEGLADVETGRVKPMQEVLDKYLK